MDFSQVTSFFAQMGDYIRIGLSIAFAFIMSLGQIITPFTVNQAKCFEKWSAGDKFESSYCAELKKDPDKDFVVLNIADVQLNDTELYDGSWDLARATISSAVNQTNPDLITLTGDNAWGMLSYIELCKYIDSFGIPWAPVMGNHDGQNTPSEFWCAYQFTTAKNCLFKFGPEDMGYGNYIINITENGKVIHSLFMMDTHSNADDTDAGKVNLGADGSAGYDHLWENQLKWYEWAVNGITKSAGKTVESTVFMHIPTVEYSTYYAQYYDSDNDCWKDEYAGECFGVNHEDVCCAHGNNGFFDLCKKLGSTKNIIVGHDHINSSSMLVDGIRLSYGLKCGSGCYWEPEMSGGSTLTISSDGTGTFKHVYVNTNDYKAIIESGTYTLKATIKNGDVTVPITLYADKGGKYCIETELRTSALSSVKAVFLSDGKKIYLILPTMKMYIEAGTTDELLGEQDAISAFTDPTVVQGENAMYVKTDFITLDGKEYVVEEYKTDDGATIKYYYLNENLKRIEAVESNGDATIIEIESISPYVPANAFSLPSGYTDMTGTFNDEGYEGVIKSEN